MLYPREEGARHFRIRDVPKGIPYVVCISENGNISMVKRDSCGNENLAGKVVLRDLAATMGMDKRFTSRRSAAFTH